MDVIVGACFILVVVESALLWFMAREVERANAHARDSMRAAMDRLLLARGLHPHLVDPQTWGPSGAAYSAAERAAANRPSDEEEFERERDADLAAAAEMTAAQARMAKIIEAARRNEDGHGTS